MDTVKDLLSKIDKLQKQIDEHRPLSRVARLLMNLVLIQGGYNIALISPVLRPEYISFIEAAHEDDGDFINLVCRSVYKTQKDYLRMLNI